MSPLPSSSTEWRRHFYVVDALILPPISSLNIQINLLATSNYYHPSNPPPPPPPPPPDLSFSPKNRTLNRLPEHHHRLQLLFPMATSKKPSLRWNGVSLSSPAPTSPSSSPASTPTPSAWAAASTLPSPPCGIATSLWTPSSSACMRNAAAWTTPDACSTEWADVTSSPGRP